jgi:hypothetical protein
MGSLTLPLEVSHRFLSTPFALPEEAHVGTDFRLRPLLPLSKSAERFYILALSLRDVRLLEGSGFAYRRLKLPEMPTSFAAATGYVYDQQRQIRTASPAALGERGPFAHGQGGTADDRRQRDVEHYFRRLWENLAPLLPERSSPIVLAAVEEYLPLVAAALRDGRLVDRCVAGSPDHLCDEELWAAGPAGRPGVAQKRARAANSRLSVGRPGRRWSAAWPRFCRPREAGRVGHLLLGERLERWGRYDEQHGLMEARALPAPGDEGPPRAGRRGDSRPRRRSRVAAAGADARRRAGGGLAALLTLRRSAGRPRSRAEEPPSRFSASSDRRRTYR